MDTVHYSGLAGADSICVSSSHKTLRDDTKLGRALSLHKACVVCSAFGGGA